MYLQIPSKGFTFHVNDKLIKVIYQLLCRKTLYMYKLSAMNCACLLMID